MEIPDNLFESFDGFDTINETGNHSVLPNEFEQNHELWNFNEFGAAEQSTLFDHNNIMEHSTDGSLGEGLVSAGIPDFENWYANVHGTPVEDALVWHMQTTNFTCGVVSSEMVMNMFGLDISEAQLVYEATQGGYLTDNGISIDGIQNILSNHGIMTHVGSGDINDLISELDQGHKIIIPLDSGEIWNEDYFFEDALFEKADHAVVFTGVNLDSEPPTVILNDPGHPEGQAMTLELEKFIDAWKDAHFTYIATDYAA